jgi:hypothetical protein
MPLLNQFKVTLRGVEPPVWRRLLVPADGTFWDLGGALSDAMGWDGICVYVFYFEEGSKAWWPDLEVENQPERLLQSTPLSAWLETANASDDPVNVAASQAKAQTGHDRVTRFEFEYNLGDEPRDGWMHLVELEGQVVSESLDGEGTGWGGLLRCVGGERACPPDDVGWAAGYARLLDALSRLDGDADVGHIGASRRETLLYDARAPDTFDPEAPLDPASVVFRTFRGADELREDDARRAMAVDQAMKANEAKRKRAVERAAKAAVKAAAKAGNPLHPDGRT